MKLSTIIRAIVRPIVAVEMCDDAIDVRHGDPYSGSGIAIGNTQSLRYGIPTRAKRSFIGALPVAWWGRDTFVHPKPEAS